MKINILCLVFFLSTTLEARRDADSIYDRQLDKMEERRILYYNRWFKQHKYPKCAPMEECECPCIPQPCPCPHTYYQDGMDCHHEGL
ncbi:MAG: hypothetical protein WC222_06495 [Parachlamydiales bacterium]